MRSKLNLLYLLIFIIALYGCGSDMNTSSNDTGSLSFALKWENPQNLNNMSLRAKGEAITELSYAPIDCTAIGVSTVSANVYDSGGTYITSGGPWNCADHSGTITGISAGINRMIAISGKDSSSRIIYNGQITGVTIDKDQTTNAGQITMTYVANDTTAPTDGTLSASAGNSQVSLSWSGFSDSGSGLGSYKLVYSTTTTPSSCSSGTQIWTGTGTSYTHTGLTNSTTYYYRLCATDNAGNTSSGATASGIPTSSGGTATTGSVPSAPTGVSASAGNGQTTVSWSSVSGATSYNIYWSTSSGVTKTTGTKITGTTSSYTHTGLTNGTTYYYVVTAVNSYGESSESSQVSATPGPRLTQHSTLSTGLLSYWKMDGSSADYVGSRNGTDTGVTYATAKINNGGSYDGSTSYTTFSDALLPNGNASRSVSLWVKLNVLETDQYIFGYGTLSSNNYFAVNYYGISGYYLRIIGYASQDVHTGIQLSTTTWYHIVVTFDGSTVKVYINNVLSYSGTKTFNTVLSAGEIGWHWQGGKLNGMVDEIGMWNRALTASEVSSLYNNSAGLPYD